MRITSIKINKRNVEGSRNKGTAVVEFDDMFKLRDIRIMEGDDGLFIALPARRSDTYRDRPHPMNPEVRAMLTKAIIEAYEKTGDPDDTYRDIHQPEPIDTELMDSLKKMGAEIFNAKTR